MQFSREAACANLFKEMMPLLTRHYNEIAHYQDIPLRPNFARYMEIERVGVLRAFTARDEDNKLAGYAAFFVQPNLHYSTSIQAVQDVIYIERSARGAGFGKEFIEWCDAQLKAEGCQVVYHHVKDKHNFGPMLEKIGYKLVDLIYARRLD